MTEVQVAVWSGHTAKPTPKEAFQLVCAERTAAWLWAADQKRTLFRVLELILGKNVESGSVSC